MKQKQKSCREALAALLLRVQIDQMRRLIRTKEAELAILMRQAENAATDEANLTPERRTRTQRLLNAGRNMQSILDKFRARFETHDAELREIEAKN